MSLGRIDSDFHLCRAASRPESLSVNTNANATNKGLSRPLVQNCSADTSTYSEFRTSGPLLSVKDQQRMSSPLASLASREELLPRKIGNLKSRVSYPAEN